MTRLTSRLKRGATALLLAHAAGCESGYPLAATACDDFCHATLRVSCDEEPEDCVRDCELAATRPECEASQRELTTCYERADDTAFVCVGDGFDASTRVRAGVCQTERDALLSCQEPAVTQCLAVCRPLQAQLDAAELQLAAASMPTSSTGAAPSDLAGSDAGEPCLLLHESCETLCWNLLLVSALSVEQATQSERDAGSESLEPTAQLQAALAACGLEELPN